MFSVHDGLERFTVDPRRPQLEAARCSAETICAVHYELMDALRIAFLAVLFQENLGGVKQQLEGGQPLLAVDNQVLSHVTGSRFALFQDHCAEEMGDRVTLVGCRSQ
jgi:hypothetical protein